MRFFGSITVIVFALINVGSAVLPRWGIMGPGRIASDFTGSLRIAGANVTAVAAGTLPNTLERAQKFANVWEIPNAYGSYDQLGKDPNVDIVYIATVNYLHYDNAKLMLNYGKNVLLEKPATMNSAQLEELQQLAKKKNLFFHVDFWTRQFPAVKWIREKISQGDLGDIVQITSDASFYRIDERLANKTLGGGIIMDMGCYQLQFATMLNQGKFPNSLSAVARKNAAGVDTDSSLALAWNSGENSVMASFTNGFDKLGQVALTITGTKGKFEIPKYFNCPDTVNYYQFKLDEDGNMESNLAYTFHEALPEFPSNTAPIYPQAAGFTYTVNAVHTALAKGEKFLKEIDPEEQLVVMSIVDNLRHQVGSYWDFEAKKM
jgi:dihydrodiol dehydrogenase / D-xylose 1-dehydrogenase (NADP)